MSDVFAPDKRAWIMSRVKNRNTKPELIVRSVIHRMGFRFRVHSAKLPGHPDIVLRRHRKVVFVNGCFWHGHAGCPRSALPETNRDFWLKKVSANKERDIRNLQALSDLGWKYLVVWTCEVAKADVLLNKLSAFLRDGD